MDGKNSTAILVFDRLPTTLPWKVYTETLIFGRFPHSRTLYRHVREKLGRHFGVRPTASNFLIESIYTNGDFCTIPTLTYAV